MELQQSLDEFKSIMLDLQNLANDLESQTSTLHMGNTSSIQAGLIVDIVAANWENILNKSELDMAQAETTIANLKVFQVQLNQLSLAGEDVLAQLKNQITAANKHGDWEEIRSSSIEQLVQEGYDEQQVQQIFDNIGSYTYRDYAAPFRKSVLGMEKTLNKRYARALAHYMGNLFAFYASRFNTLVIEGVEVEQNINSYCENTLQTLSTFRTNLYDALKENNLEGATLEGDNLTNYCLGELNENVLDLAAHIYNERQGVDFDFTMDGQKATELGDIIRDLLLSVAIGYYAQWVGGYHNKFAISRTWLRKADKLNFTDFPANPQLIEVSTLSNDPDSKDGQELSVQGKIINVTISHDGSKAISNAELEDENGNTIIIAMPYIKLDSGGVVEGTYVKVAGVWLASNYEANGLPALDIDRVDYTSMSKTNWLAWLTLQLRSVFQPIPNSLNARYSWEAGSSGAISPIRYNTFNSPKSLFP